MNDNFHKNHIHVCEKEQIIAWTLLPGSVAFIDHYKQCT